MQLKFVLGGLTTRKRNGGLATVVVFRGLFQSMGLFTSLVSRVIGAKNDLQKSIAGFPRETQTY